MDTNLYAQLHGLYHAYHAHRAPPVEDSPLEQDIQAYADSVAEEARERFQKGDNGGLESVEVRVSRVRERAVDDMHNHYASVEKGYRVIGTALADAGETLPEVPEDNLMIFEDPDAFMQARKEGFEVYELLGYSYEVMTRFYEALDSLFQQQEFEKARDGFCFLTEISSKTPEYWKALGLSEIRLEHYDKAEAAYLKALDLNPSDSENYLGCFLAYEKQEKFTEAEELCDKGIAYAQSVENSELEAILVDAKGELKQDAKEEV